MNTSKENFFYCYDYNMYKHLADHGHYYIVHARSIKTGREFWLFPKSSLLQVSIDEFISRKNHVKNHMDHKVLEKSC